MDAFYASIEQRDNLNFAVSLLLSEVKCPACGCGGKL
jgi:hypothetical protein